MLGVDLIRKKSHRNKVKLAKKITNNNMSSLTIRAKIFNYQNQQTQKLLNVYQIDVFHI